MTLAVRVALNPNANKKIITWVGSIHVHTEHFYRAYFASQLLLQFESMRDP